MGAWDELDTEISVEVDTTDIDDAISLIDDYFLEDVAELLEDYKEAFDNGSQKGIQDIAIRNRSFQQQIIAEVCKNPSGILASSIIEEEQDQYTFIVGTIIQEIYPLCVEYGRGPVYPIKAKALAFYADSGELIFRKSVGPAAPRPFVAPAYDKTVDVGDELMLRYVGRELENVGG